MYLSTRRGAPPAFSPRAGARHFSAAGRLAAAGRGSTLLSALVERARQEGVTRFEAPVLTTNYQAIRVLQRMGETKVRRDGREIALTIQLPEAPAPSWSAVLRQFAIGALQPARTLMQLIWPRRQ